LDPNFGQLTTPPDSSCLDGDSYYKVPRASQVIYATFAPKIRRPRRCQVHIAVKK
jgi:hypothetical protein